MNSLWKWATFALDLTLIVVMAALPMRAFAAEPKSAEPEKPKNRISSVTLSGQNGGNGYYNGDLSGGIGLDPIWQLNLKFDFTQNAPDQLTREGRIGLDAKFSKIVSARASVFSRGEPNSVLATGFAPGLTVALQELI